MRYAIFLLTLVCAQAQAGEWFKTVRFSGSVGTEYVGTYRSDNGVGDAPLFKAGIEQTIYTTENVSAYVEGFHISSGKNKSRDERPVNYFGIGIEAEFDWY